ncbi:hypothetical protein [Streptomyces mirabilis]|uniref:hypothetical protein n=1 Tax=Streptomyces mirabilis TaxID=68239 RepID=UPI0036DAAAB2
MTVQLPREADTRVIATDQAGDRDTALGLGAEAFVDLQAKKRMADLARGVHNEVVQHSACCDAKPDTVKWSPF